MSAKGTTGSDEFTIRSLHSWEEYDQCVELQKLTWGDDFTECVPTSIMMISQKVGGVTAGAFDASGRMVGFVWGLSGLRDGHLAHWSHMLAVREQVQNAGLGQKLKAFQRDLLLELNIEHMYWTYDPLVAKNAHLNLNRLGVRIRQYVPDLYRADTASDLHSGLGTDRFIVLWSLRAPEARPAPTPERYADAPVVNAEASEIALPDVPVARIEVPTDIMAVKAVSQATGMRWRMSTRRAFLHYLGQGYEVSAFYRDPKADRSFYIVSRGSAKP